MPTTLLAAIAFIESLLAKPAVLQVELDLVLSVAPFVETNYPFSKFLFDALIAALQAKVAPSPTPSPMAPAVA